MLHFGTRRARRRRRAPPDRPWGCSSAGRAPRSHRGGQGFESPHLHHLPRNPGPRVRLPIRMRPNRIVLVGMMGSGKSTVGRALADALGWPFLDNDDLVREMTATRARAILRTEGEAALHEAGARGSRRGSAPPGAGRGHRRRAVVDDPWLRAMLRRRGPRRLAPGGPRRSSTGSAPGRRGRRSEAVDVAWLADSRRGARTALSGGRRPDGRRRRRTPGGRRRDPAARRDVSCRLAPASSVVAAAEPRGAPASGSAASAARPDGPAGATRRRPRTAGRGRRPGDGRARGSTTVSSASGGARTSRQLNISRP